MSCADDVCAGASPATSGLAQNARGLIRWIATRNPFYVLSALCVLVGLWISFGAQVRAEQTWALMLGMSGYTLLLAVPALLLVRYGGVWEDVRTVLLLVVLMFLATSVTFDEALARAPERGITCYVAGFLFAATLSAVMLRGMRLVLPAWFAATYYLSLALFFLYPVALMPLVDRPRSEALQWALFGFSPAAGLVALTLLPAIRRGPRYVADNGSPWRWPWYPWSLFVFLALGAVGRSYLLCWSMQHIERSEPERLIFGTYFLVPFGLAIAMLVLEIGVVARNRAVLGLALWLPAGLAVLAMTGERPDEVYQGFLILLSKRLGGSPLYLTILSAAGFYAYAWCRRVPRAYSALVAALAALAVVAPASRNLGGLVAPRPGPLVAIAALELALGFRRGMSLRCLAGAACLCAAALAAMEGHPARAAVGFHLAMASALALGAWFDDALGRLLRQIAVVLVLGGCLGVLSGRWGPPDVDPRWIWIRAIYAPTAAALLAGYGWLRELRAARVGAVLALLGWLIALGRESYVSLRGAIPGLDFLAIGLVLLGLAELVSMAKAGMVRWPVVRKTTVVRRSLE
jgi:hypothetical protein